MKSLLIAGVAKSGKSTVCKIISSNKYNYIPLDIFVSSFKHTLPESNINSNVIIDELSSERLALWLSKPFTYLTKINDKPYIIDSAHLYPKDVIKYINLDEWDVYFFGYPNIDVNDKFNFIRSHEREYDWTTKRNDEELKYEIEKLINLSKTIKSQCEEYNINFVDTSKEVDFNQIINDLKIDF